MEGLMQLLQSRQAIQQLYRYLVVGVGSNAVGYCIYLLITWLGVGSVQGMTLIYLCACLVSFAGNKRWTFANRSKSIVLLPRYVCMQIVGYLTNLLLLLVLYKHFGFAHQGVQLLAMVVVAIELFLLSKCYVFREANDGVRP
jgi:putative flippase GtrA